jgi:hypothetical protein
MEAEAYLSGSTIIISKDRYAVVKAHQFSLPFFAAISDHQEVTLIQKEVDLNPENTIESETGWRIITFDVFLPFQLTGFLALVTTKLAEVGISVFALSSYSTDHILVKEIQLSLAMDKLREAGVNIEE